MPKTGGSRVRSGPPPDPNSRTSERKRRAAKKTATKSSSGELPITSSEFNPMALPARGRRGHAPAFPLPPMRRPVGDPTLFDDDQSYAKPDKVFRARELELWRELWHTPQAVAWEREPWRWLTIAKYVRIMATTEADPDTSAALLAQERELRSECGLSPDGLKRNGWAIAPDELAQRRAVKKAAAKAPAPAAAPPRRRSAQLTDGVPDPR